MKTNPVGERNEKKPGKSLKVLIADDNKEARRMFRRWTTYKTPHQIVGEARTGKDALELALMERPDVIIMDADMPDMDGREATRRILARLPEVKVLAVSFHSEEQWVHGMLEAGARGFMLKDDGMELLVPAIEKIVAGERYVSPAITDLLVSDYVERKRGVDASRLASLTDRERRVLRLFGQGCCSKEIADQLKISTQAVYKHRDEIMQKLKIATLAGLIRYAISLGRAAEPNS